MNPIHQLIEAAMKREQDIREINWMTSIFLKPHIKEGGAFYRKADILSWPVHYMNPFERSWS